MTDPIKMISIIVIMAIILKDSVKRNTMTYALLCPLMMLYGTGCAFMSFINPAIYTMPILLAGRLVFSAILFFMGLYVNLKMAIKHRTSKRTDIQAEQAVTGDVLTWDEKRQNWVKSN